MGSLFLQQSNKRKKKKKDTGLQATMTLPFAFSPMSTFQLLCCWRKRTEYFTYLLLVFVFLLIPFSSSEKLIVQRMSNAGPSLFSPFFTLSPNCNRTQPESSVIHVTAIGGPSTGLLPAKGAEGWDRQSPLGGL